LIASADKSCPVVQKFQWSKGKQYLRLDGKVSSQIRQQHTRLFNDPTSSVQVLEALEQLLEHRRQHLVRGSCLITTSLASIHFIANSLVHETSRSGSCP